MRKTWIGALVLAAAAIPPTPSQASSHREAPFIATMPKVDGTDFYMFDSYETGRGAYVTLIANYLPLQDAYGGPNYFTLDPDAIYEIHIDNNGDAGEDITFQFDFNTTLAMSGNGLALPIGPVGNQKLNAVPFSNIGVVSMVGDADQNVSETYTIKIIRGDRRTGTAAEITKAAGGATFDKPLDNIGAKSIPGYAAYADAFIYDIDIPGCTPPVGTSAKVFVGQRQEGFAVNLGQIFDLINARVGGVGPEFEILGPQDQGKNIVQGKNVTSIALEVPASCLNDATDTVIGGWTTASVRQARVINPNGTYSQPSRTGGPWVQVSRLGMPLTNEIVIGLKDKNLFNGSEPSGDTQFLDYVTHPTLPAVEELLFGAAGVTAPTNFPRTDLVATFLTGIPGVNATTTPSEMLRLNTALGARAAATQNSLGPIAPNGCVVRDATGFTLDTGAPACDPTGFPNGRRPGDDVVDIELRVAIGYLAGTTNAPSGGLPFVDGAFNQPTSFRSTFPYLNTPTAGSP